MSTIANLPLFNSFTFIVSNPFGVVGANPNGSNPNVPIKSNSKYDGIRIYSISYQGYMMVLTWPIRMVLSYYPLMVAILS